MKPVQVGCSQYEAERVYDHPEKVDNIMPIGGLDEWASRLTGCHFNVVGKGTRNKGRTQIDGDGREPNHDDTENNAVRCVEELGSDCRAETSGASDTSMSALMARSGGILLK